MIKKIPVFANCYGEFLLAKMSCVLMSTFIETDSMWHLHTCLESAYINKESIRSDQRKNDCHWVHRTSVGGILNLNCDENLHY